MNQPNPDIVQPQPVPETWGIGEGNGLVVIQIASPTGTHVSFVQPESALKIANDIRNSARNAMRNNPKLIIPDGIPPNWNGKL